MTEMQGAAVRAALFLCGLLVLSSCGSSVPSIVSEAPTFLAGWFDKASNGIRDEALCHGLGTLKHQEVSCAEMLEHAAKVTPASREIVAVKPMDCFGDVCGEFAEVSISAVDLAGNPVSETAVVKRDDGQLRLYWYRSDSLMALLRQRFPSEDDDAKDPLQAAYDEMTTKHPALYEYPPCLELRPSSSNLVGELMARDAIDEAAVEALAAECQGDFCFALVGNKIATLCP